MLGVRSWVFWQPQPVMFGHSWGIVGASFVMHKFLAMMGPSQESRVFAFVKKTNPSFSLRSLRTLRDTFFTPFQYFHWKEQCYAR